MIDERYSFNELDNYLARVQELAEIIQISKRKKGFSNCCAFDTETTSTYVNGEKFAFVYIWVFSFDGAKIVGRTIEEFVEFLDRLRYAIGVTPYCNLFVGVHNLDFDFQFICRYIDWKKVFATEMRKVVYALSEHGFMFRCTYRMTNYNLDTVAKNLTKHSIKKLIGDLDYSVIRNHYTVLTDKEMEYIYNDADIIVAWLEEQRDEYGTILNLPLTATGYVRKACREFCFQDSEYARYIHDMNIDLEMYKMCRTCFMGGFTHANAMYTDRIMYDVASNDFASSYPAVMTYLPNYPISSGFWVEVKSKEHFRELMCEYCCVFEICFENIRAKIPQENYISFSKCKITDRHKCNNGRVVWADSLATVICEIDYKIIEQCYEWDNAKVNRMLCFFKGYLPKKFIEFILLQYEKKTRLKNLEEYKAEYQRSKEAINALYGMCATDVMNEEIVFDGEYWNANEVNEARAIARYNSNYQRFLFYPWAIYVTALARYNLFFGGILPLGTDYLYSDTDSVKYLNPDKHKKIFEDFDKYVDNCVRRVCDYYNLDFDKTHPKTINGIEKPLGHFEYEGKYKRFKTLGAKRYMTESDKDISITCAGLNKTEYLKYHLKRYKGKEFDAFTDDLTAPKQYSGRLTHTYNDATKEAIVTDYQGHKEWIRQRGFVHLEKSEYHLSLSSQYIEFFRGLQVRCYE